MKRKVMVKPLSMHLGCCMSLFMVTANIAAAQSFDCSKASTKIEKMICADAEIAKLDTQMALQYKLLLSKQSANQNGVIAVQRRWLVEKRNVAAVPGALKQIYVDRLSDLNVALDCVTSDGSQWTQRDLNNCEFIAFDNSDAELRELYRKLLAEPGMVPVKEAAAALKDSQDAWLKFRDVQCEWETFDSRGGSIHPMLVFGCERVLTDERITQLKAPQ